MKYMHALLRLLERYTRTDVSYLAKGGFWLAADQIVTGLAAFLLSIAFAHFVSKDAYGTYRFLIAAFWTLTAFTMTGLPTAMGQAVARGQEGTFRASLGWSIRWGIPLGFIALGIGAYYALEANWMLAGGFFVIALVGPFMQAAYLSGSYLVGKRAFRANTLYGIVFAAVPPTALFAVMLATNNPIALTFTYLASTVAVGFVLTAVLLARFRPNADVDPKFKSLGGHFSAMGLLSTLAAQVDKLVVYHYLGAVDLAVYAFATAVPEQLRSIFGSVSTLAMPKFVARPLHEIRANFWGRLWLYTALMALVAFAYLLIAPLFFHLFFPAYAEAIPYSQVYALALIPIGSILPITLLQAREAKRELYILSIVSPVGQILALIILTSTYGLMGAVVARILGRAWGFLVAGIFVERLPDSAISSGR